MSFEGDVQRFVKKVKVKSDLVYRIALSDLIHDAQESRFKGGNMPIDTSFLVNSGRASIGSIPTGESKAPAGFTVSEWDSSVTDLVILDIEVGDKFYFGWTAEYARYMEARYGFARSAVQNWKTHINNAAAKVRND